MMEFLALVRASTPALLLMMFGVGCYVVIDHLVTRRTRNRVRSSDPAFEGTLLLMMSETKKGVRLIHTIPAEEVKELLCLALETIEREHPTEI